MGRARGGAADGGVGQAAAEQASLAASNSRPGVRAEAPPGSCGLGPGAEHVSSGEAQVARHCGVLGGRTLQLRAPVAEWRLEEHELAGDGALLPLRASSRVFRRGGFVAPVTGGFVASCSLFSALGRRRAREWRGRNFRPLSLCHFTTAEQNSYNYSKSFIHTHVLIHVQAYI